MEDGLIFLLLKIEIHLKNGRWTQILYTMKVDLIFRQYRRQLHFCQMEDELKPRSQFLVELQLKINKQQTQFASPNFSWAWHSSELAFILFDLLWDCFLPFLFLKLNDEKCDNKIPRFSKTKTFEGWETIHASLGKILTEIDVLFVLFVTLQTTTFCNVYAQA